MVTANARAIFVYQTAVIGPKVLAGRFEFEIPLLIVINEDMDIPMHQVPTNMIIFAFSGGLVYLSGDVATAHCRAGRTRYRGAFSLGTLPCHRLLQADKGLHVLRTGKSAFRTRFGFAKLPAKIVERVELLCRHPFVEPPDDLPDAIISLFV